MNRTRDLVICSLLGAIMIWSCAVLFAAQIDPLSELRGAAVTCNCEVCGDTVRVTDECFHWATPWPPAPGGPNPCIATECIMNRDYYAECPEMQNGAECRYRIDTNLYFLKRERRDGPPAACANPDYTEVPYNSTPCRPWSANFCCVVGSCGGTATETQYIGDRSVYNL